MRKLHVRPALVVLTALGALAFAVAALATPAASTVTVTAGKPAELRFVVLPKSVARGAVTFKVANRGKLEHDFKIAGKKTPKLAAGKSATFRVTFAKAGRYPYLCTLPGHAAGGMKGVFTVK